MGMFLGTSEINRLTYKLQQVFHRTSDRGSEVLIEEAGKMRDLAMLMAPRKTGALENAIDIRIKRGQKGKTEVQVYVDPSGGVGEYADRMERYLTPSEEPDPRYNKILQLGKLSLKKNDDNAMELGIEGVRSGINSSKAGVGGLFMSRAMKARRGPAGKALAEDMRKTIRREAALRRGSR